METIAGRRRDRRHRVKSSGAAQSVVGLLALIAVGAALGTLLWQLAGLPELPSRLPDGQGLRDTLSGSTLSDQDAVSVVTGIGWAALAYFGLTIALRFLCESAVRVSDGSAWARTALRFSDLVTLPPQSTP
jgi:hypothetical protein